MPYDPRMMAQIGQMGVGMMGPQQSNPFAQAVRPQQWWEPSMSSPQRRPEDSAASQSATQPPSLYDMMLSLGRMTRPEHDKASQDRGPYGIAPKDAGRLGPMGFLANLPGPGWGGGGGAR